MAVFLYGALGALLPEALRWVTVAGLLKEAALPGRRAAGFSLAITVVWLAAAGGFATALPGEVAPLTAVYTGISLPATIALVASRSGRIEVDTIEIGSEDTRNGALVRFLFSALWR